MTVPTGTGETVGSGAAASVGTGVGVRGDADSAMRRASALALGSGAGLSRGSTAALRLGAGSWSGLRRNEHPVTVGTVMSEADVVTPKGSVRFHYRVVVAADGSPSVQWTSFASTLPVPVGATFLETAPSVGDGLTWHGVGDTRLGGGPGATAPAATAMDPGRVDPSFLGAVVVYSAAESADADLPVELAPDKVLAVQPVRWSVPTRTTNVHPVDGGARQNATGTTSNEGPEDGAPTAYRIASEDLIGAVADRLGITVKDLVWLNPDVTVYGDQQYLYEDTVLNLDPFRR
jgi:hypothetical protein